MIATAFNQSDIMIALLDAGASVDLANPQYYNVTALMLASGAAGIGFPQSIRLLLSYKADIYQKDSHGFNAIS